MLRVLLLDLLPDSHLFKLIFLSFLLQLDLLKPLLVFTRIAVGFGDIIFRNFPGRIHTRRKLHGVFLLVAG